MRENCQSGSEGGVGSSIPIPTPIPFPSCFPHQFPPALRINENPVARRINDPSTRRDAPDVDNIVPIIRAEHESLPIGRPAIREASSVGSAFLGLLVTDQSARSGAHAGSDEGSAGSMGEQGAERTAGGRAGQRLLAGRHRLLAGGKCERGGQAQ